MGQILPITHLRQKIQEGNEDIVDYPALRRRLEWLVKQGLVGEDDERFYLLEKGREALALMIALGLLEAEREGVDVDETSDFHAFVMEKRKEGGRG